MSSQIFNIGARIAGTIAFGLLPGALIEHFGNASLKKVKQYFPKEEILLKITMGALAGLTSFSAAMEIKEISDLSNAAQDVPCIDITNIGIINLLWMTACAPIVEEFVVRGKLLENQALTTSHSFLSSKIRSIFTNALWFAGLHGPQTADRGFVHGMTDLSTLAVLGVTCASMASLTNDLWASTTAHITHNTLTLLAYKYHLIS